jgi:acyl carrier protein phosphodiesterase
VNFLAHLVLAPQTPEGLIGSIAPDMIQGPLPSDLHDAVASAAKEHHQVDRFTDAHAAFGQTRQRLGEVVDTRLSGILADVLYDHILARDWDRWRGEPLADYLEQAEHSLLGALPYVPARMQMIVRKMIDEQWLASYATVAGIRARLETMSQRLTRRLDRPMSLTISERDLADLDKGLTQDFTMFWPDLLAHVEQCRLDAQERLAS